MPSRSPPWTPRSNADPTLDPRSCSRRAGEWAQRRPRRRASCSARARGQRWDRGRRTASGAVRWPRSCRRVAPASRKNRSNGKFIKLGGSGTSVPGTGSLPSEGRSSTPEASLVTAPNRKARWRSSHVGEASEPTLQRRRPRSNPRREHAGTVKSPVPGEPNRPLKLTNARSTLPPSRFEGLSSRRPPSVPASTYAGEGDGDPLAPMNPSFAKVNALSATARSSSETSGSERCPRHVGDPTGHELAVVASRRRDPRRALRSRRS